MDPYCFLTDASKKRSDKTGALGWAPFLLLGDRLWVRRSAHQPSLAIREPWRASFSIPASLTNTPPLVPCR